MLHDVYISLFLYTSILLFTPLTRGYFNPVVSFGSFFNKYATEKIAFNKMIFHWCAQTLGVAIGSFFSKFIYDCGQGTFKLGHVYSIGDILNFSFEEMIGNIF